MHIIKWESLLPKDLFEDFPSIDMTGWDLATDVYETDDAIHVEMQVPGIDADNYDVKVEGNQLYVSGSRDKETEVEDKDFYRKEIHRGHFERSVSLPDVEIETDKLSILQENGTLKVVIPKHAHHAGHEAGHPQGHPDHDEEHES